MCVCVCECAGRGMFNIVLMRDKSTCPTTHWWGGHGLQENHKIREPLVGQTEGARTSVLSSASSVALVAGDGVVFAAGTPSFTRQMRPAPPTPHSLPIFPRSRGSILLVHESFVISSLKKIVLWVLLVRIYFKMFIFRERLETESNLETGFGGVSLDPLNHQIKQSERFGESLVRSRNSFLRFFNSFDTFYNFYTYTYRIISK